MHDHREASLLLAIAALGSVLATAAAQVVDPIFIWGGTECDAVTGIQACAGYPPTGLIVAIIVASAIILSSYGYVAERIY